MRSMTARDLKNRTGDALRAVRRGESVVITFRGKPVGALVPWLPSTRSRPGNRSVEEVWPDIERELQRSAPRFSSWTEAEDRVRGRR